MSNASGKSFVPMNGLEMKQAILTDIDRRLSMDSRFKQHLTYPQVAWNISIRVDAYPSDGGPIEAEAVGSRGGAPAVGSSRALSAAALFTDGHLMRSQPKPLMPEQAPQQEQPRRMVIDTEAQMAPAPRSSAGEDIPDNSRTIRELPRSSGGAGEPMTGGARMMPREVLESMGLTAEQQREREGGKPADQADSGGEMSVSRVVGAPDAVRREVGLPIPQRQVGVGGQVFDEAVRTSSDPSSDDFSL